MNPILVNLYGGPSSGKSTTRAGVYHYLKIERVLCEEVIENAKNFVWEERHVALSCAPYVWGKSVRDIERLWKKVDVIISDSPLLLCSYYGKQQKTFYPESFYTAIEDHSRNLGGLHFFLNRVNPYEAEGRTQTEDQANLVEQELKDMLDRLNLEYIELPGDRNAAKIIAEIVLEKLNQA